MKKILLILTLSLSFFLHIASAQQRLEVEGKLNLHNDTQADPPINGDMRYNASAKNGTGDFEGYLNGEWCSLTTKIQIKYDCEGFTTINGMMVSETFDENAAPGSYTDECICDNNSDDDGDGLIDCDNLICQCYDYNNCNIVPASEDLCSCDDGHDNDQDGLTDCEDPDCASSSVCVESACDDGIDNDGDGLVDCEDSDCASIVYNTECNCDDNIDNDNDGLIDCLDCDCDNIGACHFVVECDCTDQSDNDLDGRTDCWDEDCCNNGFCNTPPPNLEIQCNCFDGLDNDGDGAIDCDDPECQCA